jgi:indoleamine 2,3-dioxygenase
VLYEGVNDERRFYRGETGANDSIIPTLDNLLQLTDMMPNNPLTEALKDFRSYRPVGHNNWLKYVYDDAKDVNFFKYVCEDNYSKFLYLQTLD